MSSILKGLQLNELSNEKLAQYKKAASADATASDKAGDTKKADKRFSGIVKATKKQFANDEKVDEANNYHANRTGFRRGQRDDERHDLDVQQPSKQEWALKINGKVWSKDGKAVTFASKEQALKARQSILSRKPELEVGLVTRSGVAEDELDENCWKGYHKEGNKELFGKTVPNCVKNEDVAEGAETYKQGHAKFHTKTNKQIGPAHYGRGSDKKADSYTKADPRYHEVRPVKEQGVAEEQHSCPHCGGEMVSEELMNEKKDACYYKVKSRYKVWPSAYASGALVKCRKKGASNWGNSTKNESSILEGIEQVDENLHQWFKEKWVRFGPDGKIRGDCARGDDSEGKPKCLPQAKAHSLGKKGRASAAARKRREDPNPERSGKAINVNTKKKSNEGVAEAGDTAKGQKMLAKVHNRAADRVTSKQADKDPAYARKAQQTQDRAWERLAVKEETLDEKWSQKYKDSINCSNPKGFSQKAHCQGKNK